MDELSQETWPTSNQILQLYGKYVICTYSPTIHALPIPTITYIIGVSFISHYDYYYHPYLFKA